MTNPMIIYARALDCHKSPDNVRTQSDAEADAELKANIGETGMIIENLIGVPVPRKKGHFEIYAGSRRLAGTHANIEEGKLPEDFMVPILVAKNKEEAIEMSQMENYYHLPMNPADECMGFKKIIDKTGKTAAQLAIRFGKTERFIEGRLRLADLADPVFEALRNGDIGIEVAMAYGRTANRARQAKVFEELAGSYYRNNTAEIRRRLDSGSYSGSDPKALLVGAEAYEAAGGVIERDLYSDRDSERWVDTELLDRLAAEALAKAAETLREQEGFAEVRTIAAPHVPYLETTGLRRLQGTVPPLSEDQQARQAEIEKELAEIEGVANKAGDYTEEQEERIEALETELAEFEDRAPVFDTETKAKALAYVVIGADGTPEIAETLFVAPNDTEDEDEADTGDIGNDGTGRKAEAPRKGYSQKLIDRLAAMRTELVALHVANDPHFAMDLATFIMADSAERQYGRYDLATELTAPKPDSRVGNFQSEAPAAQSWAKLELDLDRSWLDVGAPAERFDAFRALDDEMRASWFAWAVARTLKPVNDHESCAAFLKHLGRSLDIDVARWWRPTAKNFFDAVTRPQVLDLFAEIGGEELKSRYGASKKHDLALSAERLFAGQIVVEADIKERALAWLPGPMRLFDPVASEADEAEPELFDAANDQEAADLDATGEAEGYDQAA